ncbi:MAG: hypothetical protein ABI699_14330, partial [Caldimonas sp.]
HLEATADVGAIAASLAQGIEHWNKLIRHDPTALINAAYVALLDRAPDPDGLQAYTRFLQDSKDFTQLLAHIVRSPEHRERMLAEAGAVAPSTFVAAAYRGLLGREPDEAALAAQVERLQGYDLDPDQPRSARLASLLLELSRSDEAWSRARSEHAESIVLQLRDALRDDGVEQASLADWLAAPGSTLDIGAVAAAMGKGPAHWRKLVRTDPAVLINAAYVALLGREADEGGLATYARLLQDSGDPVALLSSIGQSAEHQERVREALRAAGVDDEATLRAKAEAVVSQLHGALREGEPDAGELAGLVDHLEATADVGAVAASLAQGIEHWNKLIRDDPTALIKAAYVALLDRAPDPEGLQVYTRFLQDSKDFARLLAHIVRSPEHREHVLAEAGAVAAPALVAAAYRGLLGRAPDDAVLAGDVERLRTTGDVTGFIAELSQSNEHRKRLLLRRN